MKQMAVLGLGRFGASVARSLVQHGVEVMGVDSDPEKVADIAPDITHAVQADVMDVDALILSACEILTGDSQYQGCGDQLSDHHDAEGSRRPLCGRSGRGDAHAKILERIGADKVIMPEKDMGARLARSLSSDNLIDYMELSARHSLMELAALDEWIWTHPEGKQYPFPVRGECGGDPFGQSHPGIAAGRRYHSRRGYFGGDR